MKTVTEAQSGRKNAGSHALTDEQRAVLPALWAYLVATCVDQDKRLHRLAARFCWPRTSRQDPLAYQQFATTPTLRPWTSAAERDLLFVILTAMEWEATRKAWTVQRSIASFAVQLGCGRTSVKEALGHLRAAAFPVLKISNTTRIVDGQRYKGTLRFELVVDPMTFATQRDEAREAAQAARRATLKPELVQLQIDLELARITPAEAQRRKHALAARVKFGTAAPVPVTPARTNEHPLTASARQVAFGMLLDTDPVPPTDRERTKARELFELLTPTAEALEDLLNARVAEVRTDTQASLVQFLADLLTPVVTH